MPSPTVFWLGLMLVAQQAEKTSAPWEAAAFTATPAEMVAALNAQPPPPDVPYETLLKHETYRFDATGRKTFVSRHVYRCLTAEAVEALAVARVVWSPWYQQRPTLRARVITSDGREHVLDPQTISESPQGRLSDTVFSDGRVLQAPLPAMSVGAVVEQEAVIPDDRPFFAGGSVHYFDLAGYVPNRQRRLTIEAPRSLPLRYSIRGAPLKPRITEHGDRKTIDFETGPVETLEPLEPYLPPDEAVVARVVFSTGTSWEDIGREYSRAIGRRCQSQQLRDRAQEIAGTAETRREAIRRLLDHVQSKVRYTGLEFGESAILPYASRQTLQRGYGDCKDQSTLLVGLLRAAGHEACVALVCAEPASDVDRKMPGLNAFNHAIVHVAGNPPLWIDPTARHLPLGELPPADQGRWALIADAEQSRLVRTPQSTAEDNRFSETFEIRLRELEPAGFTWTVEARGTPGWDYRSALAEGEPDQVRARWEQTVMRRYGSGPLSEFQSNAVGAVDEPLRLRVAAAGAARLASADSVSASVSIDRSAVFQWLPDLLTRPLYEDPQADGAGGIGDRPADGDAGDARQSPLVLPQRHVVERRYRIMPPPGFEPQPLPDAFEARFGPALYREDFQSDEDHTVTVLLRFDTGDGHLSAADANAFAEQLARFRESESANGFSISFRQMAAEHARLGRIREAIAAYRRLIEEHPDQPLYYVQYSSVLGLAGLNLPARDAARRAVELGPTLAYAHDQLGSALLHDALGRALRPGADCTGAERALRQSLLLNPEVDGPRRRLAALLQFDADANRYSARARLDEARAECHRLREQFGADPGLDREVAMSLLFSGKFDEARRWIDRVEPSLELRAAALAALAADDPQAALREAARWPLAADQRRAALAIASDDLTMLRRYPESVVLLDEASAGLPAGTQPHWERLRDERRRLRRYDPGSGPPDSPERIVRDLFAALYGQGPRAATLDAILARNRINRPDTFTTVDLINAYVGPARSATRSELGTAHWRADLASLLELSLDGDPETICQVTVEAPGLPTTRWYVRKTADGYRVRDPGSSFAELGGEALAALEDNDLDSARQWVEWAVEAFRDQWRLFDAFSTIPALRIRRAHRGELDRDALRLVAAALVAGGENPQPAIPILKAALPEATPATQLQIRRALAYAYRSTGAWDDLLDVTESLRQVAPSAYEPCFLKGTALARLERFDELEQLARARQQKLPRDGWAAHVLGRVAQWQGDYERADRFWREIEDKAWSPDYIPMLLARNALFATPIPDRALDDALRAVQKTHRADATALRTLAAVYAARGEAVYARHYLHTAADTAGLDEPVSDDWFVLGLIAESYGLPDDAARAFGKVQPPADPLVFSFYEQAQQRINALRAADEPATRESGPPAQTGSR